MSFKAIMLVHAHEYHRRYGECGQIMPRQVHRPPRFRHRRAGYSKRGGGHVASNRRYLGQDWFHHGRSGEVGRFCQCMLPFTPLGVTRSKGDMQDLELVDGALHFPESASFERFQSMWRRESAFQEVV